MDVGNALQVVELKKLHHSFDPSDFERLHRYYEALTTFMDEQTEFLNDFPRGFRITLVCDGVNLTGLNRSAYERLENDILTQISWEEFLRRTKRMHQEFIDAYDDDEVGR